MIIKNLKQHGIMQIYNNNLKSKNNNNSNNNKDKILKICGRIVLKIMKNLGRMKITLKKCLKNNTKKFYKT